MYAVEVELDVQEPYLKIPNYERLKNKHVRVLFIAEDESLPLLSKTSLPNVYLNPIVVDSYDALGSRDDWHAR
ncbi:hypothetical protein [Thiomicrospira microaerophila]|uniref:hypothetical protein n=1 Tax=Thiomicrospira microaerophila TaxID=406020 RepID=UPI0005C92950|nr:hypothetical protein [Thiomicrospira microaerophila]